MPHAAPLRACLSLIVLVLVLLAVGAAPVAAADEGRSSSGAAADTGHDLALLTGADLLLRRADIDVLGGHLPPGFADRAGAIVQRVEEVRALRPELEHSARVLRAIAAELSDSLETHRVQRREARDTASREQRRRLLALADRAAFEARLTVQETQLAGARATAADDDVEPVEPVEPVDADRRLRRDRDMIAQLRAELEATDAEIAEAVEVWTKASFSATVADREVADATRGLARIGRTLEKLDRRHVDLAAIEQWLLSEFHYGLKPRAAVSFRHLPRAVRRARAIDVIDIGTMKVNSSVAPQVVAMLAAARLDGVDLRGSALRTQERQIELRNEHCGPTEEDIWHKPPGLCSPPTARPGTSMHELGLAIDFEDTATRDTPSYHWLVANAAWYGFYNLPSEPWHWSVNGR